MTIDNRFTGTEQTSLTAAKAVKPDGTVCAAGGNLIREHSIEITINEKPVLRLTCTPDRLAELVLGRLVTEGFIKSRDDVECLYICESGNRARVYLRRGMDIAIGKDVPLAEPTCCTDNKVLGSFAAAGDMQPLARAAYSEECIFALIGKFHADSALHKKTMGTHSCYLSYQGGYQEVFEDIGRHNALDKAVGYALINGLEFERCMLFTTGRVPVDMARKVITAGIPVLVSKAVPTAEAVAMAKRYHLTLICRAWPDSYEVYNG